MTGELAPLRRISAVVIAQDEAARIERCVSALRRCCDETVVVDGGSGDDTVARARAAGARVVVNRWPGYGRQRNVGADAAQHDWILWVDADEIVGDGLADAIRRWKASAALSGDAFAVRRIGDFMGRWLVGAAEWHVRLYDRRVHRVAEREVHEAVDTAGAAVGRLDGTLWHFGFRSLEDHVARFNRYTTLEATEAVAAGRGPSLLRLAVRPPARVLERLLLRGMVRQGRAGLSVALLWAYYEILRELKLVERTRSP